MKNKSKTIHFRLVELSDAEFINSLRVDITYNKYLSAVDGDISKQEEWIKKYKEREKLGLEYYYIIQRNSDYLPIGTVRLYDFLKENSSFCWGSWILNENKTRYAALESALLIYDFAFLELGFNRCHMDIRKQNLKVLEFHKKFGIKLIGETEEDYLAYYFKECYLGIRDEINEVIKGTNTK
jgi:RimJ/RimL family protein N-acetyltransferase